MEDDAHFDQNDFELFNRYASSIPFGDVLPADRERFKSIRDKLKGIARSAAESYSGGVEMKEYASLFSPNGRSATELWCCIFPAAARNKSFGLQFALILNARGAEFCCCFGAGSAQVSDPTTVEELKKTLDKAKQRLRIIDNRIIEEISTAVGQEWDFRKQWRSKAGTKDFSNFKDWIQYASSPESHGASISKNLDVKSIVQLGGKIESEFQRYAALFKPLIEAIYREKEKDYEANPPENFTVDDILADGCFLERQEIVRILDRLRTKKNIILQGPPGTGKTWLAKRLAFALIGRKDGSSVRAVQFHPNLSYEDFVRGWRPMGEGKLSLVDGIFMEAIKAALDDSLSKIVVVIEEINRGNPAQIFGELLTLLEADKRVPEEALELCYPDSDGKRRPVFIPDNLYLVGTMNVADRSLALVDLALRRRFAFVDLEPKLGSAWRSWVIKERNLDPDLVEDIERRIIQLNNQITSDERLGEQFRVGHSYVTPTRRLDTGETRDWFRQVVETEIGPLLKEYWFDAPDEARLALARLVEGWPL
ncbi:AAA family ATPase [Methylocystis sp.]|uniref:AAA family ATPase n=1 Tax=Methylocystis sp. TaxID=1911079 RepID=UPI0025EDC244|nr:AAA family ATPase [Methylocystis sp.]